MGMDFRGLLWKITFFGLKIPHPHQEFQGVPPPPPPPTQVELLVMGCNVVNGFVHWHSEKDKDLAKELENSMSGL